MWTISLDEPEFPELPENALECAKIVYFFVKIRNFGLLSFGEEAEQDESETIDFVQKNATKSKSVHDVIDDPKLSKEAVQIEKSEHIDDGPIEENTVQSENEENFKVKTDRIRDKLTKLSKSNQGEKKDAKTDVLEQSNSDSDEFTNELERERKLKRQKKAYGNFTFFKQILSFVVFNFFLYIFVNFTFDVNYRDDIRNEIKALKKEYKSEKKSREIPDEPVETKEKDHDNEMVQNYLSEQRKYGNLNKEIPKKGAER